MYIIQEIQTSGGKTAMLPAIQKQTRAEAESTFYQIAAHACISAVEEHTVMVYTHDGFVIQELTKCFAHPVDTAENGD